ncbi:uncharacterized protein LOC115427745 [Sphaeramia orbicularis]|uniref:uncharacterized protein LOC115427745 n=1 Tax=Sphaeramia orbicularis TaxID=375764 RepID=UPI00117F54FD|nr:uncharacterized protein LOC115427745 [Sphaeramia orbicularis]
MLSLCLMVFPVFICLSSADEKVCYGGTYVLPREHVHVYNQKVVFVPSNGGATKVVKGKGEVMDPRFRLTLGGGVEMQDLTEQDNGEFFMKFGFTDALISIVTLRIIDCHEATTRDYGSSFTLNLPGLAQYLEFTPAEKLDLVTVIWNRTDPKRGRGSVNRYYNWELTDATQEDNGYYKFRGKYNRLLGWEKLVVKEKQIDLHPRRGKRLLIKYHQITSIWTIIFEPVGKPASHTLMKKGTPQWNEEPFEGRLHFINNAIIIEPVQYQDSGTFEFRDKKDNLVQRVTVEVNMDFTEEAVPLPAVFFFVVIPSGVVVCCCCIKKCCCKKSSPKRNSPSPETTAAPTDAVVPAAPTVYHHGSTQPTGRGRYSTSPVPMNLPVYREPTSGGPLVTAPGGSGATPSLSKGSNFFSSDSDPKFVLEQSSFGSAPPLDSDTTISDVYTSGKLSLSGIHTSVEGEHSTAITDVYTSDKLNFKF